MNKLYTIALFCISFGLSSCNKDDFKPSQLEGYWKFESRTYLTNAYNFGTLVTLGTGDNNSDLSISKETITFLSKSGGLPMERTYKLDGKTITFEAPALMTHTVKIQELTSERLVTHTEYKGGVIDERYDTVYNR
ncbi:hypothetical protein [Hymenobacter sp. AT01-02]|uniref:hypothetical protein n=1 Tax=Hymenobacter sp. AT01-02 TaxID=1571877 RepID=UPI0005F23343|nr:hypothetical protein [Hymenobacter sp. AT01-02]